MPESASWKKAISGICLMIFSAPTAAKRLKAIPHGAKQLLEIFTNIDNPFVMPS
jgi:hypothetical protein